VYWSTAGFMKFKKRTFLLTSVTNYRFSEILQDIIKTAHTANKTENKTHKTPTSLPMMHQPAPVKQWDSSECFIGPCFNFQALQFYLMM
jgi:hypothetical protein